MDKLIGTLLEFSRLSHIDPHRETVDVDAMAQEVIKDLKTAEPERSVEVLIAEGVKAQADPDLLKVLLTNLLSNAWKYTRRRDSAAIEFGTLDNGGEKVLRARQRNRPEHGRYFETIRSFPAPR